MKKIILYPVLIIAGLQSASQSFSAVIGQVDTFEDGTTLGWLTGNPNPTPPANIPSGGPLGNDDNFLLLASTGGFGPGSRLVAFNRIQWSGDYLAAGIKAITANLNNQGGTDLQVRVALLGNGGNFSSIHPVSLPAGSGWRTATFPIAPADLTGGFDISATLANVTELRLLHSTTPDFRGGVISATLGVDNIKAVPIPGTAWLLFSGFLGFFWRRKGKAF